MSFKIKCEIIRKIMFLKDKDCINWIYFILNDKKVGNDNNDEILKKGNVVWMHYGENLGNEFSGFHPALILDVHKKSGDVYVLPIDSGKKKGNSDYCVYINRIYGFKDMPRYVNLYRAQWLSVKRIDFNNRVGHIDKKLLEEIICSLNLFNCNIDKS